MGLITFLSDFGQKDEWVAVVKGVIAKHSPDTEILDISHNISPYNVLKGALVLKRAVQYIEAEVHMAIVDPGVGTNRKAVAIQTKRGDVLVGPDNGILLPAAKELGLEKAFNVTNDKYFLKSVSPTFHARDIFAPVSAYITNGRPLKSFGPEINSMLLRSLEIKKPVKKGNELLLTVWENDNFGTARLNLDSSKLEKYGLKKNNEYTVLIDSLEYKLKFVRAFGELEPLEAAFIIDSSNQLSIAVNKGSAADILGLSPGKEIKIIK